MYYSFNPQNKRLTESTSPKLDEGFIAINQLEYQIIHLVGKFGAYNVRDAVEYAEKLLSEQETHETP